MQELIKEFIAKKRFAVVGATDNPEKYGNKIVKNLKNRGSKKMTFLVLSTFFSYVCYYHNLW